MSYQEYIVRVYGDKTVWFNQEGLTHRLDGPAVEYASGTKDWWQKGQRHRLDGPAVILADGTKEWWQNNRLHRLDGPAIEYPNGDKRWCINHTIYSSEKHFNETIKAMQQPVATCDGKTVEIEGVKYKLTLVKE
jgi:hypothetical protein